MSKSSGLAACSSFEAGLLFLHFDSEDHVGGRVRHVSAVIRPSLGKHIGSFVPEVILQAAGFLVSFAVISLLFALMFEWLPDAEVEWRDVWMGAIGTAALFEIGKFLIALYVGKQGLESTYAAAASIVVVLIWVYYTAQIVLQGAEFTNARARQRSVD
jgi:membrane protein